MTRIVAQTVFLVTRTQGDVLYVRLVSMEISALRHAALDVRLQMGLLYVIL